MNTSIRTDIPEVIRRDNATSVGMVTAVGYLHKTFPYPSGNCFSVVCKRKEYKILNFAYENLRELLKPTISNHPKITWPISIAILSDYHALINDSRIKDNWYTNEFCEVCTPNNLLPLSQRLKLWRREESGNRKMIKRDDGSILVTEKFPL